MRGRTEIGIQVKVICSECGEELSVSVREGAGNIPTEIKVDACEGCEEAACLEAVRGARDEWEEI